MNNDRIKYKDEKERQIVMTADHTSQPDKVLFFADPHFLFFNFIANAHCTHLPLIAYTQANPKAKAKECNRQRFINFI